ncbi:TPA: glycosyltransferase [Klebsiella michiganensis]|uniref:glycosyltransferase family 2 protein n=3 Tax=Klebsiella TaxID=570 RepID=UPI0018CAEBA4|nr:glycosyltransferase [Klebsiella michiganensis]ELN3891368.1 glycosyltransferase family 2 protein [Klebsiella michiganensis]ELS5410384.1 glycosyltransferase family 2 protein [Klebsiella michiganensis]MBG8567940.1 glycosyltransferase family 2 protein [Klebsiella michiganensis]MDU3692287.1 glycosyltransferase [Klebsiella michiganensis]HDX8826158.1 glycosyltransferase family 2 protein [Klebsiella michiganensis]
MKFYIAIPTYNGGDIWRESANNIKKFSSENTFVQIIDSGSTDDTVEIARESNFNVMCIDKREFNHGGTRNLAVKDNIDKYDIVIFLTQDAIPEEGFLDKILSIFEDTSVACAYGRQLPHKDANPLAQHARYFNYSEKSYSCSKEDINRMGLKSVFMSNSFSAYRLSIFEKLEGFPSNTILCEDMFYTAKAILSGYKVAYVADAIVRHSHNYTPLDEFKRYFDIGVFHSDEKWIRDQIGSAKGEGKKFIISELNFLMKNSPLWIPYAFFNNFMKIFGFKLGLNYKKIPIKIIKKLSMHKRFWDSYK